MGLEIGQWLRNLKQAVVRELPSSTVITALRRQDEGVAPVVLPLGDLRHLVETTKGQKVAYVVDVRGHEENARRIEHLIVDADTLFIECAFLDADAAQARQKNHLTARQAGLLARRACVRRLVPCHYSTRYTGRGDELAREAECAFRASAETRA